MTTTKAISRIATGARSQKQLEKTPSLHSSVLQTSKLLVFVDTLQFISRVRYSERCAAKSRYTTNVEQLYNACCTSCSQVPSRLSSCFNQPFVREVK